MKLESQDIEVVKDFIGRSVENYEGDKMGYIAGVFTTRKKVKVEYIILGSDRLFGDSTRYFALPASTDVVWVSDNTVKLKITNADLKQTKRISISNCPKPLFDLDPLLYELTDFCSSTNRV